ncbi:MAG TPA: hypothetical protein VN957_14185 [Chthoniobacterales bacterium]|jgi:hypothetical protein|nr:hypothetical protein [Chthoniobacterales bacterium]
MFGLNDFLSRIQTDHAFYLQFRSSPQEALAAYELSPEERTVLNQSGSQLSSELGRIMPVPEPLGVTPGGHSGVDPCGSFKWITNVGWTRIHETESADSKFNPEVVLDRIGVQQSIGQIRAASTHSDRLAAVLSLVCSIG